MESKCKNCQDRYVGCHDKCEHYKAYKKYIEEKKEKEHIARLREHYTAQYYRQVKRKNNK